MPSCEESLAEDFPASLELVVASILNRSCESTDCFMLPFHRETTHKLAVLAELVSEVEKPMKLFCEMVAPSRINHFLQTLVSSTNQLSRGNKSTALACSLQKVNHETQSEESIALGLEPATCA